MKGVSNFRLTEIHNFFFFSSRRRHTRLVSDRSSDVCSSDLDAMMAVVMIVLNGMVGVSLILGGLRYHEQAYNLQGANAFLAVILPLAVLGLVLPNFTASRSEERRVGEELSSLWSRKE